MIDINAQCLHGSPYQSSSHSVCSNTELRNSSSSSSSSSVFDRRSSVNQIKNASIIIQHRNRDFHTPSVIISNDQSHSLLNAPKPSLKISQDNILFMKKDHLIKLNCESQINANSQIITRISSIFNKNQQQQQNLAEQQQQQPPLTNDSNFLSSTPFTKSSVGFYSHGTAINSAFVGAPRLALNVSFQNSQNNPARHVDGMSYSPTDSPSINISTSPSCGDNAGNDDHDDHDHPLEGCSNLHTTEKDPPLRSTKVRCTSVQQAKCSNFCHTNDTSLMALRCRICLEEGDEVDGLLSPCRCKGSVGLVHRNCLEKWLLTSGKANCELCGYAYILTPSYRCSSQFSSLHHLRHVSNEIRSVGNWLNWRRTRRHLIADVICMIVLTSATYTAVYFCVVGALDYAQSNPLGWKVFGLCGLAVLLIFLLSIWMISIIKYHLGDFRNYQHHLQQMALAETVQLSALPTYRFSVQPRPRGSSIVLCTLHRDHELSLIPQVHETQILSPSNKQSVDVNGSVSDDQSLTSSRSASSSNQQIVTTVSLTTVPEVTDDFFSSSSKTSYVSTTQI